MAGSRPLSVGLSRLKARLRAGRWRRAAAYLDKETTLPVVRQDGKDRLVICRDVLSGEFIAVMQGGDFDGMVVASERSTYICKDGGAGRPKKEAPLIQRSVSATAATWKAIEKAAAEEGVSVTVWVRGALDAALRR